MTTELTVVTYNMRKGKGVRRSRPDLVEIAQRLGELRPDVLLCQEVFHDRDDVSQSDHIAESLELLHRYEPNAEYARGHHGNATFTNLHITHHENLDISTNPVERRGVLWTRVVLQDGRDLHLFNTHFGLSKRQRLKQAREVGLFVRSKAEREDPVLLGGDFNDWQGTVDEAITDSAQVTNGMLRLAMADRTTWSTKRPLFALDRVYFRNLALESVEVLKGAPWDRLSDHFPIRCRIRV